MAITNDMFSYFPVCSLWSCFTEIRSECQPLRFKITKQNLKMPKS